MQYSHKALGITILLSSIGLPGKLQAQGYPCTAGTVITGEGEWSFLTEFNHGFEWGIMGCGWPDDTARFWRWSPTQPGDYKIYTLDVPNSLGFATTSLALSTSLNCSDAWMNVVGCSWDSDVPIDLPGLAAGTPILIQVTAYNHGFPKRLVVEKIRCDAGSNPDDGFEENDTPQASVVIGEGTLTNLTVRHDDPDFYEVLVPAGEELLVQADRSDPDTRVTIFDDQGQAVETELELRVARFEPGTGAPHRATIRIDIDAPAGTDNCSSYDLVVITHTVPQSVETFCDPATPNSTGNSTDLFVFAPYFQTIPGTVLQASVTDGPPGEFGYLIAGSLAQNVGLPMGSQSICIGGIIVRYNVAGTPWSSIGLFDGTGRWIPFENEQLGFNPATGYGIPHTFLIANEMPNGLGPMLTGQSLGFQLWHRDGAGSSATSNGVRVVF